MLQCFIGSPIIDYTLHSFILSQIFQFVKLTRILEFMHSGKHFIFNVCNNNIKIWLTRLYRIQMALNSFRNWTMIILKKFQPLFLLNNFWFSAIYFRPPSYINSHKWFKYVKNCYPLLHSLFKCSMCFTFAKSYWLQLFFFTVTGDYVVPVFIKIYSLFTCSVHSIQNIRP